MPHLLVRITYLGVGIILVRGTRHSTVASSVHVQFSKMANATSLKRKQVEMLGGGSVAEWFRSLLL